MHPTSSAARWCKTVSPISEPSPEFEQALPGALEGQGGSGISPPDRTGSSGWPLKSRKHGADPQAGGIVIGMPARFVDQVSGNLVASHVHFGGK